MDDRNLLLITQPPTITPVFYLSAIDDDGDIVRCRFPSSSNECGYLCGGLSGSTIDRVSYRIVL